MFSVTSSLKKKHNLTIILIDNKYSVNQCIKYGVRASTKYPKGTKPLEDTETIHAKRKQQLYLHRIVTSQN